MSMGYYWSELDIADSKGIHMGNTSKDMKKLGRQWVGVFGGAVVGWLLTLIFPELEQRFSLITVVLWSAVIGGVLTSLGDFMRAGAVFTRRDNPALNLAVGLGVPILLLAVIFLLFR
jgi:hypothetical protein